LSGFRRRVTDVALGVFGFKLRVTDVAQSKSGLRRHVTDVVHQVPGFRRGVTDVAKGLSGFRRRVTDVALGVFGFKRRVTDVAQSRRGVTNVAKGLPDSDDVLPVKVGPVMGTGEGWGSSKGNRSGLRRHVTDVVHQVPGFRRGVTDVAKGLSGFRRRVTDIALGVFGFKRRVTDVAQSRSGLRRHLTDVIHQVPGFRRGVTNVERPSRFRRRVTSEGGTSNGGSVKDGVPVRGTGEVGEGSSEEGTDRRVRRHVTDVVHQVPGFRRGVTDVAKGLSGFRRRVTDIALGVFGFKRRVTDVAQSRSGLRRHLTDVIHQVPGFRRGVTNVERPSRFRRRVTSEGGTSNGGSVKDGVPVRGTGEIFTRYTSQLVVIGVLAAISPALLVTGLATLMVIFFIVIVMDNIVAFDEYAFDVLKKVTNYQALANIQLWMTAFRLAFSSSGLGEVAIFCMSSFRHPRGNYFTRVAAADGDHVDIRPMYARDGTPDKRVVGQWIALEERRIQLRTLLSDENELQL
uniref:Col_cuticle_N domain-containing protein n=1 Tax=Heligmosomoides polygyrus TaxID=6339 RepID=A0A183GD82_HELPZ